MLKKSETKLEYYIITGDQLAPKFNTSFTESPVFYSWKDSALVPNPN